MGGLEYWCKRCKSLGKRFLNEQHNKKLKHCTDNIINSIFYRDTNKNTFIILKRMFNCSTNEMLTLLINCNVYSNRAR